MSDRLLRALLKLFALCAKGRTINQYTLLILENFIRQNISPELVEHYLQEFKDFRKSIEVASNVDSNILFLAEVFERINDELNFKRKYILLLRIAEFIYSFESSFTKEDENFIYEAAGSFNLNETDVKHMLLFIRDVFDAIASQYLLAYGKHFTSMFHTHEIEQNSNEELYFLFAAEADLLVMKAVGLSDVSINNQPVPDRMSQIIIHGAVIRTARYKTIYFSEIHKYFVGNEIKEQFSIVADEAKYCFEDGTIGLHPFSLKAESGTLTGVIGNSGAGKSTLLGILNGSLKPACGRVLINGKDVHGNDQVLEQIGYIPQDDLLIAELTVFENLYYSARLSLGNLSDDQLRVHINKTLNALGLYEIRNFKVGDALNKYISGGQRKRLNIALELIREPKILLIDEPTSGLSSNDAENIMDLMREIADHGSVVIVVIHQPSSEIFKLFDTLTIFDKGGYNIYNGQPLEAILYFKKAAGYADSENSACISCGNVNPEIVFTIVELKLIDTYGRLSASRKVTPAQWYTQYRDFKSKSNATNQVDDIIKASSNVRRSKPSKLFQYLTYFKRDIAVKSKNVQYLLVNLLIAPLLAIILSLSLRYHATGEIYSYASNNNIPVILFVSVIVAFFLGLSISAEEIIRDKHVLKRESFLRLSRNSYLLSKITVLFAVSGLQMLSYVTIVYWVLELNTYWSLLGLLFITSCSAVLLGLNLSSGFKSAVTVYILIPFIVIPQLLLSGILVRFDRLNNIITANAVMPVIGNTMISRWVFEPLALCEYYASPYIKQSLRYEQAISKSHYIVDYWYDYIKSNNREKNTSACLQSVHDEAALIGITQRINSENEASIAEKVKEYYIERFNGASEKLRTRLSKDESFENSKKRTVNKALDDLLRNKESSDKIKPINTKLIRMFEPLFDYDPQAGIFSSPMYNPVKLFLGFEVKTVHANIIILTIGIILMYITLYLNLIAKGLSIIEKLMKKKQV